MLNIKQDILCVFDRDPAARHIFEVLTTYPGLWAVVFHRINHNIWRLKLKWISRFGAMIARLLTGVEIHPAAKIGKAFFIDHGMGVVIGETTEIGDNCSIYHGVTLGGTSWNSGKRHPTLNDNVVIGAGAKILGPITLGKNSRVGSNSVVVKNVPENTTVIGIPARTIVKSKNIKSDLKDFANKIGFDAYGTNQDIPDPVMDAIDKMLAHIHSVDQQINMMCDAIKSISADTNLKKLAEIKLTCMSPEVSTDKKK